MLERFLYLKKIPKMRGYHHLSLMEFVYFFLWHASKNSVNVTNYMLSIIYAMFQENVKNS